MTLNAKAADSDIIKSNIQQARHRQAQAHQMAEIAREFGEADNHPTIIYAKEKWAECAQDLSRLYPMYNAAVKLEAEQKTKGRYIGRFRISHYCPCAICNGGYGVAAVGTPLTPWYTIAVDSSVIPLNSSIYIEGYGTFKAQDTGGAIKGKRIDVCVNNHAEANSLGVIYRDVYLK